MKNNKLLLGIVFILILSFTSVLGAKVLDINANPTVTSDTTFYGTPIGGNNSNGFYVDFDGSTDYFDLGTNIAINYSNFYANFTLSTDDATTEKYIISQLRTGSATYNRFCAISTGVLSCSVRTSAGGGQIGVSTPIIINEKHNYIFIQNGLSLELYVDGVLNDSNTIASYITSGYTGVTNIGRAGTGGLHFNGKIYDVEIGSSEEFIDYSFNATPLTDWSGNGNNAEIGTSGQVLDYINSSAQAWSFGSSEYFSLSSALNNEGNESISTWVYLNSITGVDVISFSGGNNGFRSNSAFYVEDGVLTYLHNNGGVVKKAVGTTTLNTGQWYYVTATYNGGDNLNIYVDSIDESATVTTDTATGRQASVSSIGAYPYALGTYDLDGLISQVQIYDTTLSQSEITEIYNNGAFYNGNIAPTPSTEDRITETIFFAEQVGTTTVNSPSYVTIFSGTVEVLENQTLTEATAAFNINYTSSNTATCRIVINGTDQNSEASRSGSPGSTGSMYIQSEAYNLTSGNYTAELQCKKVGGSSFTIFNSFAIAHFDKNTEGEDVPFTFFDSSINIVSSSYSEVSLLNGTTGIYNGTDGAVILAYDVDSSWNYDSTGNLSFYGQIKNSTGGILANGSTFERYGNSGDVGSGGLFFLVRDLPQNTSYEVVLQVKSTTGDGSIDFKGVEKEFFMPLSEAFENDLNNINFTGQDWSNISTNYIDTTGYGSSDIVIKSSISAKQLNGITPNKVEFRYLIDGVAHGLTERSFNNYDQPGIISLIHAVEAAGSNQTIILQGRMSENNGSTVNIVGGNFLSYIASDLALEDLSYNVSAIDIVYNSSISDFSVAIENGAIFNSFNGSVIVFPQSTYENFTVISDNYFNTTILNHHVINDIEVNMTPYLILNFTASSLVDNSSISNFSVNCSNYLSLNTTTGFLYYQLTDNANLTNISCSFESDGFANTDFNVSELNYSSVNNYNIEAYTTNSVYIYYRDAITKDLLTNVTLELISESYSVSYDLGSNSSIYLDLLSPDSYELRSTKDGYSTGFYAFTLSNRTFTNLTLYLSNGTTEVSASVTDQFNNPLEGAIIKTLKYDIDSNSYLLQSIRSTNFEGKAILSIFLNAEYYRFIIEYPDGTIVKTTDPTYITETTITFKVTLGEEVLSNYYSSSNVDYSLIFNPDTNNFRYQYNDNENTASSGCLYVYKVTYTDEVLYNSSCVDSPTGVILVGVEEVNGTKYIAKAYIAFGDESQFLTELIQEWKQSLDSEDIWLFILFLLTFATIFFMIPIPNFIPGIAPMWFAIFSVLGFIPIPSSIGITAWIVGLIITFWVSK